MLSHLHFISGLPRSGSTLLAAILKQNPAFHASMSSPLAEMYIGLSRNIGRANQFALFISDAQRQRLLRSLVDGYYAEHLNESVVFDTNRSWCEVLASLVNVFPAARVICCLRNPAWILDGIERYVQRDGFRASQLFDNKGSMTVYDRVQALLQGALLGGSMKALRQAWFGEHADRLIAIRYDSLVEMPAETMVNLYHVLGEKTFVHDFEHLEYDEPEFDFRLGIPGFHKVARRVEAKKRDTILPLDLFKQNDHCFWEIPEENPRKVLIL